MSAVSPRAALSRVSAAVIGASDQSARPGGRLIAFLEQCGFAGASFPANPRQDQIRGLRRLPRIADIPAKVDLAVMEP
jgi:acyl-CoA synthetase (NDP forming)